MARELNQSSGPQLPEGPQVQYHLLRIFDHMYQAVGDPHWWPADTQEEVVIGAILVQSVAWSNTVSAIQNLRNAGLLSFYSLYHASESVIEPCIIPTRYYRMKTKKLKAFATHVMEHYKGNLNELLIKPLADLRCELLSLFGIGPETADDIVLYASQQPSFVVDAYTKRIFHRLGFSAEDVPYEILRDWFMRHLPTDVLLFNRYHALLDHIGHHFCGTSKPTCSQCPLSPVCSFSC